MRTENGFSAFGWLAGRSPAFFAGIEADLSDPFTTAASGSGFLPQYHEKVFAIFQTLEARDTVESTGIGLSLMKKVDSKGETI